MDVRGFEHTPHSSPPHSALSIPGVAVLVASVEGGISFQCQAMDVITPGDNCTTIAARNNIVVSQLTGINPQLDCSNLVPGRQVGPTPPSLSLAAISGSAPLSSLSVFLSPPLSLFYCSAPVSEFPSSPSLYSLHLSSIPPLNHSLLLLPLSFSILLSLPPMPPPLQVCVQPGALAPTTAVGRTCGQTYVSKTGQTCAVVADINKIPVLSLQT